ncbi:hypothetical protein Gohar_019537 [Gossypium harknessii]|uniref:Uncharacterized protein n=1 Tax=Gossypium harknessii TaxID=34285 RepID=A0A7J9I7H6_9ROSI|nr:hypothetical protein [Gossypium harknessii]
MERSLVPMNISRLFSMACRSSMNPLFQSSLLVNMLPQFKVSRRCYWMQKRGNKLY